MKIKSINTLLDGGSVVVEFVDYSVVHKGLVNKFLIVDGRRNSQTKGKWFKNGTLPPSPMAEELTDENLKLTIMGLCREYRRHANHNVSKLLQLSGAKDVKE